MNFINPIELLDVVETDAAVIKLAKRRKLLEFELSDDGMIEAGNRKVSKSDFLRVTDELDNNDKAEFYFFIKNKLSLNAFLKNGNTTFFAYFRHESIYSDREFIEFVSPYFAAQYSKALLKTFVLNDSNLLMEIVGKPLLTTTADAEEAYKGLSDHLKKLERELQTIRDEIDNEESYYDEFKVDELVSDLRGKINVKSINALPNYFQLRINKLAQNLRNISVVVFNSINDVEESFRIISLSLELESSNLTKQNLQKDYEQIKEVYESRKESEKYSPELTKYAAVLIQIVGLIKEIKDNQVSPSSILVKVNSLFSVYQLNQLPSVFDEIREQIALSIRGLSVAVWNEKNDIDVALGLIEVAQEINLKQKVKREITKAQNELSGLRDKQAEPILKILRGINNAIIEVTLSYNQTVNTDKIKSVLKNVFNSEVILLLSSQSLKIRTQVIEELDPIMRIMPKKFAKNFAKKIETVSKSDKKLTNIISKWISVSKPVTVERVAKSTAGAGEGCLVGIAGVILELIIRIGGFFLMMGFLALILESC